MTDSPDYRRYLEEKFEGMQKLQHGYFREVHDRFDIIEKQNEVRNGRIEKNEKAITDLKIADANHITNCPVEPEMKKLNDELAEYKMLKKYPKLAIGIIAFVVISTISGIAYGFKKVVGLQDDLNSKVNLLNTPVTDPRSGNTYLMPAGMLIDSLNKEK